MKVSLACLAAVTIAAPEEKKFVNKSKFMQSEPPKWWPREPAYPERFQWNQENTEKLFSIHFADKPASLNLKPLFEDLLADAEKIYSLCAPGRKRRAFTSDDDDYEEDDYEDDSDPMDESTGDLSTRKVVGNIKKDIKKYTLNIARWIKYEIYDKGGECEFLGHRMVSCNTLLSVFNSHLACSYRQTQMVRSLRLLQAG